MINVVLIHPPTEQCVRSYSPQVNASEEGIGFKPPLGLLYIATYLKHKLGNAVRVKIFDCPTEHLTIEQCAQLVIEENPDIVGISAWSDFWYPSFTVGKKIKESLSSCCIVYGGPHVAIYPEITLNAPHVDAIVVGDGEEPFHKLVKSMLEKNEDYLSGEGLHFKQSGINYNSLFYIEKDLDNLPIPERTLLDIKKYNSVLFRGSYSSTMITSRGCPYQCNFCKLHFQKAICRNSQNVVDEFKYIEKVGIKEVEVYDDTFTWSHKRVREICEMMIRDNIKIKWAIRDRVNSYDEELLKLLKQAGCIRIHYGVESGVQNVLEIMQKSITLEQIRRAVIGAKKLNFEVLTYYMFGNIDETMDDMEETVNFALSLPSDYASFSMTVPYPGTSLYDTAIKRGIISYDYWREFAKKPVPNFVLPQFIENICSKEEMIRIQKKAMKKFYLRPKYVFRQIRNIASVKEFMKKSKMAWGMLLN